MIGNKTLRVRLTAVLLGLGVLGASLTGCANESAASQETANAESAQAAESATEEASSDVQLTVEKEDAEEEASSEGASATEAVLTADPDQADGKAQEASSATEDNNTQDTEETASTEAEETTESAEIASTETEEEEETKKSTEPELSYSYDLASTYYGEDSLMQIVVLGDSQFGNFKGYDGLGFLISDYCHANVYNLAIGGMTAAHSQSDSKCGIDMAQAVAGVKSNDFLGDNAADTYVKTVMEACNFDETDIFIVEFGVNDFLQNIPLDGGSFGYDYRTAEMYIGYILRDRFPNAKIIFCGPSYTQFFSGNRYLGDINTYNNDYGQLIDYYETLRNLVDDGELQDENVVFYESYLFAGIDSTNAYEYMAEDGIHMNQPGREKYSKVLARYLIRMMGYHIGEGVDPSSVEWWTTN